MGTRHTGLENEVRALDTYIKLMRAAESVGSKCMRQLTTAGLTLTQFGVLEVLYHLGPLHQCQIATKLLKSGANITLVLDNLEKQGLIAREKDPADRRSITVRLTDEGQRLIQSVFPSHAAFITEQMSQLEPAELEELGRLCRKLGRSVMNQVEA